MDSKNEQWGYFDIILEDYMKAHNISKNKLANDANLQRTQLIAYCKNAVQRPDLGVLARICYVLNCDISSILKYVPPTIQHNENDGGVKGDGKQNNRDTRGQDM